MCHHEGQVVVVRHFSNVSSSRLCRFLRTCPNEVPDTGPGPRFTPKDSSGSSRPKSFLFFPLVFSSSFGTFCSKGWSAKAGRGRRENYVFHGPQRGGGIGALRRRRGVLGVYWGSGVPNGSEDNDTFGHRSRSLSECQNHSLWHIGDG